MLVFKEKLITEARIVILKPNPPSWTALVVDFLAGTKRKFFIIGIFLRKIKIWIKKRWKLLSADFYSEPQIDW